MQFKHPEILYFLFLLIIPILVHLFQLRRFKKEYFTNVRFLKELSIQTRKSSKLKKWLLLATRMLLLAAAVIAFAQPYFPAKDNKGTSNEMFIVIDNSFSMQARGQKGELLRRAVEDLLEHVPENSRFSLLTNEDTFWDTDIRSIRRELQNLKYSPAPFQPANALAKINAKNPHIGKDIVVITDAVGLEENQLSNVSKNARVHFVIPEAEQRNNISVDSVYISQVLDNFYEIDVTVSAYGSEFSDIQLGLYDNDKLVAKAMIDPEKKKSATFTIPKKAFHGYASVGDNGLKYDNTLFFSISKPELIKVLSIGDVVKSQFLSRIYTEGEFNFTNSEILQLDYNEIDEQDVVILNELEQIPQALQTTLKSFTENGGTLVFIPNAKSAIDNINGLFSGFGVKLNAVPTSEKQVTRISFNHPLFSRVFEKKVQNFQYPTVRTGFALSGNLPAALSFESGEPFLASINLQSSSVYIFTAPIDREFGNFQNSPLIVPAFYNMAQNTGKTSVAAFTISDGQSMIVDTPISKDEILKVSSESESFIPMQQILSNKVKLTFGDYPSEAGNFGIYNKDNLLKNISFNYARNESDLSNVSKNAAESFEINESINSLFSDLQTNRTDNTLWKWFVALALLFLTLEILIQKLLK